METTARLMRSQGYHATGLNQIIEESQAPKGSLYHYFPQGKEELAAEALAGAGRHVGERLRQLFDSNRPGDALDNLVESAIADLEASDYQNGCPIALVGLEAGANCPALRQICAAQFEAAVKLIGERFLAMGVPAEKAHDLAQTVFAGYEGALLLSRVTRDPQHLRRMATHLNETIRQARQA